MNETVDFVEKNTEEDNYQLKRSLLRAKLFNKIALENYQKEKIERKKREEKYDFILKQKEAFGIIKKAIKK